MPIIILTVIAFIYLLAAVVPAEKKFSINATKTIRIFLFVLSPALIALLVLSRFNIYPRGYWVTKGIFCTVVILMMILFGLGNKSGLGKFERIIYGFIFYLPLGFIPLLLIPFLGAGIMLLFYVSFIGDGSFILFADENIRVEKAGVRFMGPDPPMAIYVKDGLFSYKDTVLPVMYDEMKDSLRVELVNDSTYFLTHIAPDSWQVPEGFTVYKYSMKSK
jgi:hypothetical protein